MALRMMEVTVPSERADDLRETIKSFKPDTIVHQSETKPKSVSRFLVETTLTGPIIDAIDSRFGFEIGYQLVILPVAAALPLPKEAGAKPDLGEETHDRKRVSDRVSRVELFHGIRRMGEPSRGFLVTTVLSTIVAAVGIINDNVAVIIGAMVIAPLLGPNIALAFGSVLGDAGMIRRAMKCNAIGVSIALALSIGLGVAHNLGAPLELEVPERPETNEFTARTEPGVSDAVLALASGTAGALAITSGASASLVGVMVAVALLPPTVVVGISIGAGLWMHALGATLLLLANMICINLSAVCTFWAQGIRPRTWWEASRARKTRKTAAIVFLVMLAILLALIVLKRLRHGGF